MSPEVKSEFVRWVLGEKKLYVLSGPWFWSLSRVTETCRNGVETTEGHGHNAVRLKVKLLPSETMKPEKKFKNRNQGIIYLIPSSGHDISLKWGGKKICETFWSEEIAELKLPQVR